MKSRVPVLDKRACVCCGSDRLIAHQWYETLNNGPRLMYACACCGGFQSETRDTAMHYVKTPISLIATVLRARDEGMGQRATARTFKIGRQTVINWEKRFAALKPTLKLYLRCHDFIRCTLEADELYTKVGSNKPAMDSEGWTGVLMERASRFILEEKCGAKNEELFMQVIQQILEILQQCEDLTLFSDGERRYGNLLFALCSEKHYTGKRGRPPQTLPKNVKVRVKNKGSQSHNRGPKRPKYQAPWREHPHTKPPPEKEIHANHLEAQNASLRRKNSCYRRKTNTYAKNTQGLQRTLDRHWISHNFIHAHHTTHIVPAVALGIIDKGITYTTALMMQRTS